MVDVISEFFAISGIDMTAPADLAELIPYLLKVFVAVVLVVAVFRVIALICEAFIDWRRFR